jgi:hypothetical protein
MLGVPSPRRPKREGFTGCPRAASASASLARRRRLSRDGSYRAVQLTPAGTAQQKAPVILVEPLTTMTDEDWLRIALES